MDLQARELTNAEEQQLNRRIHSESYLPDKFERYNRTAKISSNRNVQEEPEYFLVSERYVGNVKDPSMKIHLLDETSIQRNYNRVPKLLLSTT